MHNQKLDVTNRVQKSALERLEPYEGKPLMYGSQGPGEQQCSSGYPTYLAPLILRTDGYVKGN